MNVLHRKKRLWNPFLLVGLLVVLGVCGYFGAKSYAADEIYIEIDGTKLDPGVPVEMSQKILQLNMKTTGIAYEDSSLYQVDWTIENQNTSNPVASIAKGSSQTIGLVTALSPGDVTVTVTVRDRMNGNAELAVTTCKIKVIFSIDTTVDNSVFKYAYDNDKTRSLVLYSDSDPVDLTLNFGESTDAQWISNNTEIVTVEQRTGKVRPVGAGKTTISATFTPVGSITSLTASLDVYVLPRVADDSNDYYNNVFYKSLTSGHNRGDYIYLDTVFGSNNTEPLGDKVVWVIKQDDGGNRKKIADSLSGGMRSDLISLEPSSSKSSSLEIQAKAGVYYIEFYTKGMYESETRKTSIAPTVVTLTVYGNFEDFDEVLQVGDKYDLATALNLTLDDFKALFVTPVMTVGGTDATNYAKYDTVTGIISTYNSAVVNVKTNTRNKQKVQDLTNPSSPYYGLSQLNIRLNVVDDFGLDRSSVVIYKGQQLQLSYTYSGTDNASVKWTSSNEQYVKVNPDTGLIEGMKETAGVADIVVTASLTGNDGKVIKNATCLVKVEATVNDFTLNPEKLVMKIGDVATVKAVIKQTVSVAPLKWIVDKEDAQLLDVEVSADNKSAVLSAKKSGKATITVYNTLNGSNTRLIVDILQPIETIGFENPIDDGKLYQQTKVVRINYTPLGGNTEGTDMIWASTDESVATIEQKQSHVGYFDALVTMKKPGVATFSVSPKYNPHMVMAMCVFTVHASATDMVLEPENMTLNAAYGVQAAESQKIKYTLTPEGCETKIRWMTTDASVATVDDTGLVTAKSPGGPIYITAISEENITKQVRVVVKQPSAAVEFSPATYLMKAGETYKPTLKLTPASTTDTFTWKSFDTKVANVDKDGKITAAKAGKTFIQVTTSSGQMALLQLTVQEPLKGLSISTEEKTINKDEQFTLTPIFTPAEAYNKTIKWSTSNESVATVKTADGTDNVVVTGVGGGICTIRGVSEEGGYTVICIVTVVEKTAKVTVSPKTKYLQVGKSFTVKAVVSNPNATSKGVKWSSSNKKLATVSSKGKVKAKKKTGTVYITAKAKDGSGASAKCKVVIVRKITSIKLNRYTASILVGKTIKLKKYIKPKNASVKSVSWSSSNNTIATVDATGRVHGLSEGMVKIRVKAKDGSNKSAVCLISVREPVSATGVSVGNSELVVAKGRTIMSGISISPANSTDSIHYFSDNPSVASVNRYGKITAKRTGQATIYGETSNGKRGYTEVLVVGMNRTSLKMRVYDTETLSVNEISTGVTWYSSNPLVASVMNGKVVGRKKGTTTIYATVRGVKVSCKVTIIGI